MLAEELLDHLGIAHSPEMTSVITEALKDFDPSTVDPDYIDNYIREMVTPKEVEV